MPLCAPGTYHFQSQLNPALYLGVSAVASDVFALVNATQPFAWTLEGSGLPQHLSFSDPGGTRVYVHFGQSPLEASPLDPSAMESQIAVWQFPNGSYAIVNHDRSYIADQNGDQPNAGNPVIPWSINPVDPAPRPNQLWIVSPA
jgi:hypothetical protein